MILVSYDISNDKQRTKFSKYLEKFGSRIQCSVFIIRNSEAFLRNVRFDIENRFSKKFTEDDSVYIFRMNDSCEMIKYGHSAHDDENLLFVY